MSKYSKPRAGSLQVWPRVRANRPYARIRNWVKKEEVKILGFLGYKVGMTHAIVKDNTLNSITKGQIISVPITILECPPLGVLSLRFYKKSFDGLKIVSEVFSKNIDKEVKRRVLFNKKDNEIPKEFDDIRIVVYSKPKLACVKRKKPEIIELGVSGNDNNKKLELLKGFLDKDIKISDIFKTGQLLDIHGVTKGKGFQSPIKRFGVKRLSHKSKKKVRGIGTMGPWHPHKVRYSVPNTGKMGYHQRTEYNKLLLKLGDNLGDISKIGGFNKYGFVKNNYLLIKGSVVGTVKRAVILTEPIRAINKPESFEIISLNIDVKK